MAVTNYFSVNGVILGEETDGVRSDYLTDGLGSVVAVVDDTGAVVSERRSKPYGDVLSSWGNQPIFGWVGSLGYRRFSTPWANVYVRARHYDAATGRWVSVDPLWPNESAYGYAGGNPVGRVDPTGLVAIVIGGVVIVIVVGVVTVISIAEAIRRGIISNPADDARRILDEVARLFPPYPARPDDTCRVPPGSPIPTRDEIADRVSESIRRGRMERSIPIGRPGPRIPPKDPTDCQFVCLLHDPNPVTVLPPNFPSGSFECLFACWEACLKPGVGGWYYKGKWHVCKAGGVAAL